jgi:hypothetical protein
MNTKILGLTLTPPWAWVFQQSLPLNKDVENREWRDDGPHILMAEGHIGNWVALHGSKYVNSKHRAEGQAALDWLHGMHLIPEAQTFDPAIHAPQGIVALAQLQQVTRGYDSPWAIKGCWHLVLAHHIVLPQPIPYGGGQGFWYIKDDAVISSLREAFKSNRKAVGV